MLACIHVELIGSACSATHERWREAGEGSGGGKTNLGQGLELRHALQQKGTQISKPSDQKK
jgi:hypothetical protein